MATYILRRILIAFPVLLGITIVSFVALSLAPGDPLTARMDPDRARPAPAKPAAPRGAPARARSRPARARSATSSGWRSAVQGDLGYSIQSHRPISEEIAKRIPPTLALMIVAILIAVIVGIPLGILSALRPYSKADYGMTTVTLASRACPRSCWASAPSTSSPSGCNVLPSGGMQTSASPARRSTSGPTCCCRRWSSGWPAPPRCCATRGRACSRRSTASTSWRPRRRVSPRTPSSSAMPSGTR